MNLYRVFYLREGLPRTQSFVAVDRQAAASIASGLIARIRRWCKDVQLERVEEQGVVEQRQKGLFL